LGYGVFSVSPVHRCRASPFARHGWDCVYHQWLERNHVKDPEARSKDIEASKGFTVFLGAVELAGGLGVIFGVLAQLATIGLILIMLGAIQRKTFVWRTGFWGKSGTNGWSYDTMLVVMNLVIVTTGGGNLSLMK
jgi:putative oxidoreductase